MINYYDLLKPAQKDYYSELLASRLRGSGGGGDVEEIEGVPPLTFQSDGTPLLDWYIIGNTVQNGTPTPDNPIMPQGCGVMTANLFNMSFYEGKSGITVSGNKATGTCDRFFNAKLSIPPELYGQELTWSAYFKRPDNPNTVRLQTADNGSYKYGNNITGEGRSTVSFTATSTIRLYVNYANTGSDTIELSDITLNLGSTALPHEPFGVKIPILCGNQTTNIYLGETQSTRAVKKLVLTGEENWEQQSGQTADYFRISNMAALPSKVFCTHFLSPDTDINYASTVTGIKMQQSSSYGVILACRPPNVTGLANFKSFLATQYANGTPVTVWYVLATPETATINEPLMKIGDYADSIDKAGAGVNIPTSDGINTLSVNTSVQPSEVYIKYKK